jgi:ElaB/YqjD/DUF883 family membrane-anchored ribosome-binding protein
MPAQTPPYGGPAEGSPPNLKTKATDQFGNIADKAADTFRGVSDQAEQLVGRVAEQGREVGERMQEVAGNMKGAVAKSVKDQPMTTLAVAAVLGFVLGALWKSEIA